MRWLAALLLAAGPALAAPPCPFPGQAPKLAVQLFFGQSINGAGLVSRRAWARFVADTVAPALPEGFTMTDASGQYVDKRTGRPGREPTELVLVVADDTPALRTRIQAIADAYRRRFDQGAVGIVSTEACASF